MAWYGRVSRARVAASRDRVEKTGRSPRPSAGRRTAAAGRRSLRRVRGATGRPCNEGQVDARVSAGTSDSAWPVRRFRRPGTRGDSASAGRPRRRRCAPVRARDLGKSADRGGRRAQRGNRHLASDAPITRDLRGRGDLAEHPDGGGDGRKRRPAAGRPARGGPDGRRARRRARFDDLDGGSRGPRRARRAADPDPGGPPRPCLCGGTSPVDGRPRRRGGARRDVGGAACRHPLRAGLLAALAGLPAAERRRAGDPQDGRLRRADRTGRLLDGSPRRPVDRSRRPRRDAGGRPGDDRRLRGERRDGRLDPGGGGRAGLEKAKD